MEYILITNDIDVAKYAQDCGVHRIMVDLEIKGKVERQGHLNTLISKHSLLDIEKIRKILINSKLQVRVNPIDEDSGKEIQTINNLGADIIMLPMFTTVEEVETFINLVNKKAKSSLLLETPQAMARVNEILKIRGIDEVHIGLNDLHLGLKLDFMFELLSGGLVEYLSKAICYHNIKFGFGGIARLKNGSGAIDPSLILSEHFRLKSEVVILSRDFFGSTTNYKDFRSKIDLKEEIQTLNDSYCALSHLSSLELEKNREKLKLLIKKVVDQKRNIL